MENQIVYVFDSSYDSWRHFAWETLDKVPNSNKPWYKGSSFGFANVEFRFIDSPEKVRGISGKFFYARSSWPCFDNREALECMMQARNMREMPPELLPK